MDTNIHAHTLVRIFGEDMRSCSTAVSRQVVAGHAANKHDLTAVIGLK
jgi:hypothetical protein